MHVHESGKPAVTHFRVIERLHAHTYVDVRLETGRTHQIRVHFAYRRNPLVGDQTYGGRLAIPKGMGEAAAEALRSFKRQALHACELTFAHPASGEPTTVSADPPQDFRELLDTLRANE